MTTILLLNGPPRCGKDSLGRELSYALRQRDRRVVIEKFANAVKSMSHGAFGVDGSPDAFEDHKDRACDQFYGATPRAIYIAMSEKFFKPLFGEEFFGRVLSKKLERTSYDVVVVTDSGFESEARPLIAQFGAHAVRLVRITRPGTDFSNDSRSYLEGSALGIREIVVRNDGPREALVDVAAHLIQELGL